MNKVSKKWIWIGLLCVAYDSFIARPFWRVGGVLMLVCLRHMDKNKKPYGPNEVYVVNSLQKFVALVMNEKIGCTFRQLCEEYGIAGQDSPPPDVYAMAIKEAYYHHGIELKISNKG